MECSLLLLIQYSAVVVPSSLGRKRREGEGEGGMEWR